MRPRGAVQLLVALWPPDVPARIPLRVGHGLIVWEAGDVLRAVMDGGQELVVIIRLFWVQLYAEVLLEKCLGVALPDRVLPKERVRDTEQATWRT